MSFLAILVLSHAVTPKSILDRYERYRKLNPAFIADWSLSAGAHKIAQGTIMVDGMKRLLFKATNGEQSYSLSESEKAVVEISPHDETYDEWPVQPIIAVPPSRLTHTGVPFIPQVLLRESAYARQAPYKVEPPIIVNGEKADVVSWEVVIQLAPVRFTLAIDSAGRIVQLSRGPGKGDGPGMRGLPKPPPGLVRQNPGLVWTISNYRPIAHTSLSAFLTPLPRGFVPYSMPPTSDVRIGVDDVFPSVPWQAGSKTVTLKPESAGKPEVILITAPDCIPSQKALADLNKLESRVPGVSFKAVSLARSAAEAHGLPYDSTGKAATAIGDTSTPLFVLVDRTGKIKNMWAGFDPDAEGAFSKQIADAVKKLTSAQS